MDVLLWVIFPYLCLATFVVGHLWRYRYDKFGWTTRSSQMYESKLLRIGSPMFHFGLLFVIGGHVIGLVIPKSWTQAVGVTESVYHATAVVIGAVAGVCTVVGMLILLYRRRMTGPVFAATTAMDKVMYAVLATVILLGLANTVVGNIVSDYDYRDGVSVWWRQFATLHPDPDLMVNAPLTFQLHTLAACALFALWPFTRLVHVFSAPVGYLWRPYIVYRAKPSDRLSAREVRRGWERSELPRPEDQAAKWHRSRR